MRYGISELTIVPIRSNDDDKAEMISQVLFGEHFQIIESKKKWSYIKLAHDEYKGWICNKQWIEISKETYLELDKKEKKFTTNIIDVIQQENNQLIVMGSILPFYHKEAVTVGVKKYKFTGTYTNGYTEIDNLINNAQIYLKSPYLWGGRSPFGIDCSGFVQIVYRLNNIKLPRDAHQQVEYGTEIISVKSSKKGDLGFFSNKEGNINHVGIILENNYIIHASGEVRIDILDEKGILNRDKNIYTHKLEKIKRIIN